MQKHAEARADSTTHTPAALEQLLGLFTLESVTSDHFIGQSLDLGFRNLFGGHILGQALVAAGNTCEQRDAHSLHAYFIRGGDPLAPIHYHVDRIRDGNTFSVRRVVASQGEKAILILSASFQADEQGFEHQAVMPDVPSPESLAPELDLIRERAAHLPDGLREVLTQDRPIDFRPVVYP